MSALTFAATCPRCGAELAEVNPGAVVSPAVTTWVGRCTRGAGCGREWQITARAEETRTVT